MGSLYFSDVIANEIWNTLTLDNELVREEDRGPNIGPISRHLPPSLLLKLFTALSSLSLSFSHSLPIIFNKKSFHRQNRPNYGEVIKYYMSAKVFASKPLFISCCHCFPPFCCCHCFCCCCSSSPLFPLRFRKKMTPRIFSETNWSLPAERKFLNSYVITGKYMNFKNLNFLKESGSVI